MNRLAKIAARLPAHQLDAMLICHAPGERYAVGFHGEGVVLVTADEYFYFTDSRYIEAASAAVAGVVPVMGTPDRNYRVLVREAAERLGLNSIGFEEGFMTVRALEWYQNEMPNVAFVPAQKLMTDLRASKDPEEVALITRAQRIAEAAFAELLGWIAPGMTEREVAARLLYDMLRLGAEGPSFDIIAASGPNSSLPHGVPGERKLQKGDLLTLDFGCIVGGYCSDMTRTIAFAPVSDEMRTVYDTVLNAQLAGISAAHAGIQGKEIDAAARRVIADAGYGQYFGHGFGHSVGLEIHEGPNASPKEESVMPVGAVITAEPGIYLPGQFGVRIEDMLVLTETGCENLTLAPKELIIL